MARADNPFQEKISAERTQEQFDKLLTIIKTTFGEDSDRTTKLLKMYDDLQDYVKYAPASGVVHYHYAYEGGYLDHILRVNDIALSMVGNFKKAGGTINFTREELVFSALHHDLGKIGDEDGPYYVPETSDWHREKQAKMFKSNPNAGQYLNVYDRSLYLLNKYGVAITKNELLGIRLANGMYSEENKSYLMSNAPFAIKSALPYIMHWADHMATIAEQHECRALLEG